MVGMVKANILEDIRDFFRGITGHQIKIGEMDDKIIKNDNVSVELISNTDGCMEKCEAVIKVCCLGNDPISLDHTSFDLWFEDEEGNEITRMSNSSYADNIFSSFKEEIQEYEISRRENVSYQDDVPDYGICEKNQTCSKILNKTFCEIYGMKGNYTRSCDLIKDNICYWNASCIVSYHKEDGWKYDYLGFNPRLTIKTVQPNECEYFKITGSKGIHENVDWRINLFGLEPDWAWWNSSFQYTRKITFDKWTGALTENLTNFPILVVIDDTIIDYSDKAKPDGTDLRFIDDNNSTELDYHIELWNTSGDSFVWVKVPLAENTSTDHIWMYYNYSLASDVQDEAGTYNADYVGVWHLHEHNSTPYTLDSTQYHNDGSVTGAVSNSSGKIANGTEFDGSNDYINTGDLDLSASFSLGFWLNANSFPGGGEWNSILIKEWDYGCEFEEGNTLVCSVGDGSGGWNTQVSSTIPQTGEWYYVIYTWDQTNIRLYINATNVATSPENDHGLSNNPLLFGSWDTTAEYFNGMLDEARISNTTRSAAWINASYLTMTEAFSTFGSEASGVDNTAPTFSNPSTNTTIADTPCNFTMTLTDETALSGYIFETNNTGTFVNSSFTSVSGASITGWNVSTLNSTVGTVVQWRFYANDTSDNWGMSTAQTVTTTSAVVPVYVRIISDRNVLGGPELIKSGGGI